MTQQRSNDEIRADLAHYDGLMDPACTDRLVADVAPLLARVSELETENERKQSILDQDWFSLDDLMKERARAERAEAQVRAVREQAESWRNNTMAAGFYPEASAYANAVENCGDALVDLLAEAGLSLQEEQE